MQRICELVHVRPEAVAEYKRIHAEVWPSVLARLRASHITNYSIYLREPENLLIAYYEYAGDDLEADMAAIAADPETQRWSAVFPELPGCASAGDTEEEAIANAKEALELWFEPSPESVPAGAKVVEVALA